MHSLTLEMCCWLLQSIYINTQQECPNPFTGRRLHYLLGQLGLCRFLGITCKPGKKGSSENFTVDL